MHRATQLVRDILTLCAPKLGMPLLRRIFSPCALKLGMPLLRCPPPPQAIIANPPSCECLLRLRSPRSLFMSCTAQPAWHGPQPA